MTKGSIMQADYFYCGLEIGGESPVSAAPANKLQWLQSMALLGEKRCAAMVRNILYISDLKGRENDPLKMIHRYTERIASAEKNELFSES